MSDYQYAVTWEDGFPTCLCRTIEDAQGLVNGTLHNQGIKGTILTIKEYLEGNRED